MILVAQFPAIGEKTLARFADFHSISARVDIEPSKLEVSIKSSSTKMIEFVSKRASLLITRWLRFSLIGFLQNYTNPDIRPDLVDPI